MSKRAITRPTPTSLVPALLLLGGVALGCGSTIGPHGGTGGSYTVQVVDCP
jgi:hypothetical protein